ncbi:MAG: hypothetical protein RLZZ94_1302 [Bacteroidota bacterium]|jgi:methionyl-tRNA formyltransferase
MKIIYYGTPEFAVPSLNILVENGYDVVAVVTAPDKPAGRGQQLTFSAVKEYALSKGLKVLQPEKLKAQSFLDEVKSLQADLQIVVAFRMMPEVLWSMPPLGTFNLHGSLLPQYRGAAPINRAVMNGEKVTGLTTFFLQQEIDTGSIIFREEVPIGENESAGELHDQMMQIGATLVLKTVQQIEKGKIEAMPQSSFFNSTDELKHAPKIFKEDCKLNFSKTAAEIHNHIRGLSPYPGAFVEFQKSDDSIFAMKIFKSEKEEAGVFLTHQLVTDGKTFLKISGADGFINVLEAQLPGKKRMPIGDLLRGFHFEDDWRIIE